MNSDVLGETKKENQKTRFSKSTSKKKSKEQHKSSQIAQEKKGKKQTKQVKGIIFDFDGVISSFKERLAYPFMQAALMVKSDISAKKMREASWKVFAYLNKLEGSTGPTNLIKFTFKIGKFLGMTNFQAVKLIVTSIILYRKNRKNIVPILGARSVLQEILSLDYKVALVTNSSEKVIEAAIEKIPELKKFDVLLTRDDFEKIKPHASGIRKALRLLDLEPNEVITIGDQASDIIASKRAGLETIAVSDTYMRYMKEQLVAEKPIFIIEDIRQLPQLLRFLRDRIIEDIRKTIDLTEQTLQEYQSKSKKTSTH
ncbi:MAG: HAD-IA family hydrolase [Asgard group archaeon]|nr:HAD-IA family hydrolase [Asgard group archaeon]